MSSTKCFQAVWFDVLPLPDLIGKDKERGKLLTETHKARNFITPGLIIAHVGTALKHHFITRGNILPRIRPGRALSH